MVTYSELFQLCLLIASVIGTVVMTINLIVTIINSGSNKKK